MASAATLTRKADSPLSECTGTENPSAPVGRWVFKPARNLGHFSITISRQFNRHSDKRIERKNVGRGEDFLQVIYCGVQKGMIDNSRLCNKGLTNRETVVTVWAAVVFCLDSLPSEN